jgi:hypothetical protein
LRNSLLTFHLLLLSTVMSFSIGASSGLLVGCMSLPLVFASQLLSCTGSMCDTWSVLLWLSLCCSSVAFSQIQFTGGNVMRKEGPDRITYATIAVLCLLAGQFREGMILC